MPWSRRRKLEQFPDFPKENNQMIACSNVVLRCKTTGGSNHKTYNHAIAF